MDNVKDVAEFVTKAWTDSYQSSKPKEVKAKTVYKKKYKQVRQQSVPMEIVQTTLV